MKRSLLIPAALFITLPIAIPAAAATLIIELSGLPDQQGALILRVYDSKKDWLEKPLQQQNLDFADLEFQEQDNILKIETELPAGEYAVHVIHDRDGNGELKTNFIGIPREPTGVSNNAKGKFGPPKYKDAAFELGEQPVIQQIKIAEF